MQTLDINLSQLVTFYFVAKEGGLSQASEKLCITQPAVTQQIKALEKHFGVKLITVKRNKVGLTKAGETLLPFAEEFYRTAVKAQGCLKSYTNDMLRVGISGALSLYFTPVIDRFKELHPAVRVTLREGRSLRLVEELLDFEHDLCIVAAMEKVNDHVKLLRITNAEPMVVVASPGHPLADRGPIAWEELACYPFILHCEGSVSRSAILKEFKSRNISPSIGAEIDNVECMKQLIQEGKGVGVLMLRTVEREVALKKLKVLPLSDGLIRVGIDIMQRSELRPHQPCEDFLALIRDYFHGVQPE